MRKVALFTVVVIACIAVQAQSKRGISILGDSYSTFKGYVVPDTNYVWYPQEKAENNDVQDVRQLWWHQMIREHGYRLCQNNSFSGATICHTGYKGDDYSDRSFCTRLRYLGSPDVILVFGGTNDSWAKSPIGDFQYGNWQKSDLYNFRPAMAYLLANLQNYYPGTEVYVIINTELSEEVTSSMKTICDHYNVKYIQLVDIEKQWGHPSQKGMKAIADQVAAALP
ncbi:SGNH/GDSL hydrolase family protein [Prevotella sp. tf2-5]|jgi:lysophospholipase L1-like esterase|uniref:SGNH/GDSL hydrolase family protein n=1 Tax=Prevotella sp. tf2-5 TaxID=1761889 RepID=UPI0008E15031|nr:SGNH/GDSL hydrolase family protein [Prevotella sp. tf2-5]SFP12294.1 Lysophospholipase L1 [Prevotella sp. tf2-5]